MTRNTMIASILGAAALLAAGMAIGAWWSRTHRGGDAATAMTMASDAPAPQREALYWYDPMVPAQRFDKPGKSPFMDMQLVPKYAGSDDNDGGSSGDDAVRIAADVRQNLGIRTVIVRRGRLATAVRVPGTITWDLRLERVVSARVDAIVDHLYVRAPLDPVRPGQPLATILAPGWSSAIAESRALASASSASARALQSAARERLQALGVPEGSAAGRGGRITLTSQLAGVVSEIGVREGEAAPMGTLLFRVNGTATVWLEAALPQADSAGTRAGTAVTARVGALPGKTFDGRVETLLPQVDIASRTQRARIVLDNPDGLLAPGMFAEVTLAPAGSDADARLLVPVDAVIGSGAQARVIVQDAKGRFRPVRVGIGRSGDGSTEILSGLEGGERVVASGQFLIDSEASLSGALERLDAGKAPDEKMSREAMPDDAMPDDAMRGDSMKGDSMTGAMEHGAMPSDSPSSDDGTRP